MDRSINYGLTTDWWLRWRDKQPVKKALLSAFVGHWEEVLEAAFLTNKTTRRGAVNVTQVADYVYRNSGNLYEWRKGNSMMTCLDLVALAHVTCIPVFELFRDALDLLQDATLVLCENGVTRDDARLYAAYCLEPHPFITADLDEEVVKQACTCSAWQRGAGRNPKQAILDVAGAVGRRLQEIPDNH